MPLTENSNQVVLPGVGKHGSFLYANYLRNTFDVWNVHGIMNTSGVLNMTPKEGLHVSFARDQRYS